MAQVKIKVGAIEFTANGGAELIAQEREAFVGFLKHKMGEDLLAAQRRREAREQRQHKEPDGQMNARRFTPCNVTPEVLKAAINEERLETVLQPFDEIDIPLDTGGAVTVLCAYVEPEWARFVLKDCWDEAVMNEEATNKGGYFKSEGRAHVLVDIWPHISQEWREIIKPRKLVEIIDGERIEYSDPMWLPSATDVFGPSEDGYWADEADSFQLPIFEKERDRVKECGDSGTYHWWLRSVYSGGTTYFRRVCTGGGSSSHLAYSSYGFAPGFDI